MFLKSTAIFSFLTFISRIFGFIRDMLIANYFGLTPLADAFNIALKSANCLRNIFAEGSFSAAFVPIFSSVLTQEGKKKALHFSGQILSILSLSLVIITILMEYFMPQIVNVLAPGFSEYPEKFKITIELTRITTPYLLLISLVTFYSCILNSINKFALMSVAPVILNIIMIIAMYCFGDTSNEKVYVAAWSVLIGGIIQLIITILVVKKNQVNPKPEALTFSPEVKKFFSNLFPAIMSSGISQITLWIGTIIATTVPGAVSVISYSDRIIQLPVSLIGVSIGIVILPKLSKCFKNKDLKNLHDLQNRSVEFSLALSLPCTFFLCILSQTIIFILFQRGGFSELDTIKTVPALVILSLGVPSYILNKILLSSFFSCENTKTPMIISSILLCISCFLNFYLMRIMGYTGICLASTIIAWANTALLMFYLYKNKVFSFDQIAKNKIIKMIIINFLFALILYISYTALKPLMLTQNLFSLFTFTLLCIFNFLFYIFMLYVGKIYTKQELKTLYKGK